MCLGKHTRKTQLTEMKAHTTERVVRKYIAERTVLTHYNAGDEIERYILEIQWMCSWSVGKRC